MKKIAAIIILLFTSLILPAQTFHSVIYANTNDKKIGKYAKRDIELVKQLCDSLSANLSYNLNLIVKDGNSFKVESVKEIVDSLNVEEKDIVFFYIVSHGSANSKSEFPRVSLFNDKGRIVKISSYELYETLCHNFAHAAAIISITQACNSGRAFEPQPFQSVLKSIKIPLNSFRSDYSRLFANKIRIISCSSQPGKTSYTGPKGSYFTRAFCSTLDLYSNNSPLLKDWENVFVEVQKEYDKIQYAHKFKTKNLRKAVYKIQRL
ncbi:caspase family protein [Desertivirga brevis]|uniref:caspase family protein n=1 Tax=Desertivirga brevis TaxID=2810310 RepID=UPI001A95DE35|nr:caspase family protein [Pedobacter sp. SYSU D00873]